MIARRGRPILVTGSHRSGSTWVGKMIASHPRVVYLSEPFNCLEHPACPVRHHFHYITEQDEAAFAAYLRPGLEFRPAWWQDVSERPHPRRLVGATLRKLRALRRRLTGCRPLMKDPLAFFSAEWLASRYDMDVIVLIRNPLSFVSSLKRLGWLAYPFGDLAQQPLLLRDLLGPFRADIEYQLHRHPADVIEQGIVLWRLFHELIRRYEERHPDWIFLRHEDLSLNPLGQFRELFGRLGLAFTPAVQRTIQEHSSQENPAEAPGNAVHALRRDSRANLSNWKHRLTPEEAERVRRGTADVARWFYPEETWPEAPGRIAA